MLVGIFLPQTFEYESFSEENMESNLSWREKTIEVDKQFIEFCQEEEERLSMDSEIQTIAHYDAAVELKQQAAARILQQRFEIKQIKEEQERRKK